MKYETISSLAVARQYREAGYWTDSNLIDYFDRAVERTPDKTAVVAPDGRITYRELAVQVNRAASRLKALGIVKGEVISLQLPNCIEFVCLHLAATRIGAITNPLLHNYRANELSYILKFARTVAVFIPGEYRKCDYPELYDEIWPALPDLKHVFVVGGKARGNMRSYEELVRVDCAAAIVAATEPFSGDDVSALIFTSGTESTPKGVMHSHNTLMYGTVAMAGVLGLTQDDVVWTPSPISHGTGFQWGVRQALTLGATLVLQDVWNADDALRLIARERCTYTLSATPFAAMLLESPLLGSLDISSLRIFASAGAAIPHQLGVEVRDRLGCNLIGMWGMSECFVGSASLPEDPEEKRWGTDGKPMPGVELAIFDETRTTRLPAGEVGELATRGPNVALGYFNDPERTATTFSKEGWLFSNDLATMDADGYIRLVGRKKDIVNRGGLKISVREIEEHLLRHPKILTVTIVGVPDKLLGEKSCAFVTARDGASLSLQELTAYLEERGVAKYKYPEYLSLIDQFPMTPSGKIQRFALRDGFINGAYRVVTA